MTASPALYLVSGSDVISENPGNGKMNFSAAIRTHVNWRLQFPTHCRDSLKEAISIQTIAKDNANEQVSNVGQD
jgi:hypothetical protein